MTIYKISGLKPITHGSEPENLQRAKGPAIIGLQLSLDQVPVITTLKSAPGPKAPSFTYPSLKGWVNDRIKTQGPTAWPLADSVSFSSLKK